MAVTVFGVDAYRAVERYDDRNIAAGVRQIAFRPSLTNGCRHEGLLEVAMLNDPPFRWQFEAVCKERPPERVCTDVVTAVKRIHK